MADWHVGQKVVCIHDLSECGLQMELVPKVGGVYTIRAIEWGLRPRDPVFFRLEEIVNEAMRYRSGRHECSFGCQSFRPIVPSVAKSRRAVAKPHLEKA